MMTYDAFAPRSWALAHGRRLELGPKPVLMGILNVTPDSFSDGGRFGGEIEKAVGAALAMASAGASIIDVGGESTRPGAVPVSGETERARVLPVIEALAKACDCIVSVDTYRAETAAAAVACGAHIINDVWGAQKDPEMARVAAESGAGLCLMHTGRDRQKLDDVIEDQIAFLERSLSSARAAGVADDAIVLDPGFGFAKSADENLSLMKRLGELQVFGFPILVGTSRKRFIRHALGREDANLDIGTGTTSVLLRERGAAIFRVHDVATSRDALAVAEAMRAS